MSGPGWTPTARRYKTEFGLIYYGGTCKDDYANMTIYDQGGGKQIVELQGPAMRSFKAAQVGYAKKSGWSKDRIRKNPDGRPIIILPGSKRSCATQRRLYASDPNRYANPNVTGHTRGLAIDVSQNQTAKDLANIKEALMNHGWNRVRPDDEPWHYSFFVEV